MQSRAATVEQYLAELPEDRRAELEKVRRVIRESIDPGFVETMGYGMMGYAVPHGVYPAGYHCDPKQPLPFAGMASQKGHLSLYLMGVYEAPGYDNPHARWFREAWARTGKKLDMGKSCIRFKRADDLALDVIAESFRRMPMKKWIEVYEQSMRDRPKKVAARKAARSKAAPKKTGRPAKKAAKKAGRRPARKTAKRAAKRR